MRGGEHVLEAIGELFPSADLFTLVCDKRRLSDALRRRTIQTSLLQKLPGVNRFYPYYLPLFPFATRRLEVADYDLVISSDAATVKGVPTGGARHICYCHTPMRYVWEGYETYRRSSGPVSRTVLGALRGSLSAWDFRASHGVTHFIANSRNVQRRIRECYGRDSVVIYPPVDTDRFHANAEQRENQEEFLVVSQLVPYKRVDLLVDAFNRSGRRLAVIGDGPERARLQKRANRNVRFFGWQPDTAVVRAMQRCTAFVFAGEEDFGIVMAEAQACGKPVIAFGRGGAREIVEPGVSGLLFEEQSAECVLDAFDRFARSSFDPAIVRRSALRFSRDRFQREFAAFVESAEKGLV
jgi:glycosyltransferase involved in cell wall biosynthesis